MSSMLSQEDHLFLLFSGVSPYYLSNQQTSCQSQSINNNILSPTISLQEMQRLIKKDITLPIARMAKHTVWFFGKGSILILKESPNLEEDLSGKLYVGKEGYIIQSFLRYLQLSTELCLMNLVPWRPPGGRHVTQEESLLCQKFFKKFLMLKKPKIIVTLGKVATHSFLNTEKFSEARGKIHITHFGPILPTIAPSLLLKNNIYKKTLWEDFLKLKYYYLLNY